MQAYLLQAGSGKPRVAASLQGPAVCSPTVALRVLDSALYSTYSVVPANRLNRVELQLSPDGK